VGADGEPVDLSVDDGDDDDDDELISLVAEETVGDDGPGIEDTDDLPLVDGQSISDDDGVPLTVDGDLSQEDDDSPLSIDDVPVDFTYGLSEAPPPPVFDTASVFATEQAASRLPPAEMPEEDLIPELDPDARADEDASGDPVSLDLGDAGMSPNELRAELSNHLDANRLDEALSTMGQLLNSVTDDQGLWDEYDELRDRVIGGYFPGKHGRSIPSLGVSPAELIDLVRDPLMGLILSRLDGVTAMAELTDALPDIEPGTLYRLLSRAKGKGLVRID
jgi:hypothetical protein